MTDQITNRTTDGLQAQEVVVTRLHLVRIAHSWPSGAAVAEAGYRTGIPPARGAAVVVPYRGRYYRGIASIVGQDTARVAFVTPSAVTAAESAGTPCTITTVDIDVDRVATLDGAGGTSPRASTPSTPPPAAPASPPPVAPTPASTPGRDADPLPGMVEAYLRLRVPPPGAGGIRAWAEDRRAALVSIIHGWESAIDTARVRGDHEVAVFAMRQCLAEARSALGYLDVAQQQ